MMPLICPRCAHSNRAGARFCGRCGLPLGFQTQGRASADVLHGASPNASRAPAFLPVFTTGVLVTCLFLFLGFAIALGIALQGKDLTALSSALLGLGTPTPGAILPTSTALAATPLPIVTATTLPPAPTAMPAALTIPATPRPAPTATLATREYTMRRLSDSNDELAITKITVTNKETIVSFRFAATGDKAIRVHPPGDRGAFFIVKSGGSREYKLMRISGIPISPDSKTLRNGDVVEFTLVFERIDDAMRKIDLIEGEECEAGVTCWYFIGVQLY